MKSAPVFIRTVLGDIPASSLGICYSHEHIVIDESFPVVQNQLFRLNDLDKIIKELQTLYALGVRSMVDTMPADAGRNVLKLAEVSRSSNINIIAPTGLHLEEYYLPNHWRYSYIEDQLTRLFIDDIIIGIDKNDYNGPYCERTGHKAGMIKLATGDEPVTKHQQKIFHAVVAAHLETGAPILTHTNHGLHALEQALLFKELGADLSHVVISHVDRYMDLAYHSKLLQTGINLEYDSAFRWLEGTENQTFKLLEKLLPEFPDQIVVGMDAAKSSYWKSYGGKPGLDYLVTTFRHELRNINSEQFFDKIMVDNPARLYSFLK
jgi:phosphotriesterase-related protein